MTKNEPATLDFGCTRCGNCCHDLKLPLSVAEAATWVERGDPLQLLCEAIPWVDEPGPADLQAHYKRKRSFEIRSGTMPARVIVTLAASFRGACPHLQSDMRCGIYETRPGVCRIYPAEINAFVRVVPSAKACPPEAWAAEKPPFMRGGVLVDDTTRALIGEARQASQTDVELKARLCAQLGIRSTALANEGFVAHSPDPERLAKALHDLRPSDGVPGAVQAGWQFVSNRETTLSAFAEIGADALRPDAAAVEYLDLHARA